MGMNVGGRRNRRAPLAEINVVPYIDVMLVLLIIFMITAPLLSQGIKVDLPQAQAKALSAKELEPIVVSVDAQGNYYLNIAPQPDQPLPEQTISSFVTNALQAAQQNNQQRQVLVKGDQHVDYGKVVQAMVLLQNAGAASVGLITQPPDNRTGDK